MGYDFNGICEIEQGTEKVMINPLEEAKQAFYKKQVENNSKEYRFDCDVIDSREALIELAVSYIKLLETTLEYTQEMKQYWMDMTEPPTNFHIDL